MQSFAYLLQKGDPNYHQTVSAINLKGDTLVLTVTDGYTHSAYQARLEFAQAIHKLWSTYHDSKSQTQVSPINLIDATGTIVGGIDDSGVWVKRNLVFVAPRTRLDDLIV